MVFILRHKVTDQFSEVFRTPLCDWDAETRFVDSPEKKLTMEGRGTTSRGHFAATEPQQSHRLCLWGLCLKHTTVWICFGQDDHADHGWSTGVEASWAVKDEV